jgi:hypothetical protein
MKVYWEWIYRPMFFLTSALVEDEWSVSRPGHFIPGVRAPCAHWIGGWMDPRAGLDDTEKWKFLTLPGLGLWPFGRPTSSQSDISPIWTEIKFNCQKCDVHFYTKFRLNLLSNIRVETCRQTVMVFRLCDFFHIFFSNEVKTFSPIFTPHQLFVFYRS